MHRTAPTDLTSTTYDDLLDGVDVVLGRPQRTAPSDDLVFSVLATLEVLGLALLDRARRPANAEALASFGAAFEAFGARDRQHLTMLEEFSGTPVTTRFWLPEPVLTDAAEALVALAGVKSVTAGAYVLGVRLAAKRRNARLARMLAAVASAESDHRMLALLGAGALQGTPVPDTAMAALTDPQTEYKTANTALVHVQRLGIGFDRRGSGPGEFVDHDLER